ncbi:hypothetical protein ASQ50_15950 [Marinobacter sp. LQ44]|nr:hypothetical protein ASQ50_15950 [Marinobacter sp. LQ44]
MCNCPHLSNLFKRNPVSSLIDQEKLRIIEGRGTGNSCNGYCAKRLKGQHGEVPIQAPRDRDGSFEPQFVRKGQSRVTQMDDKILAFYARA